MNPKHLEELIKPFKPLKDIDTIIVETNRIFHKFDAEIYDTQHPEIFEQLPPIYKEMCDLLPQDKKLRILDFGCGTGFEASQILSNLENIEILCCYDISDEMLSICKQKLSDKRSNIVYLNKIDEISNFEFNVLVTNSLLHHLPKPFDTISNLMKYLSDDCYYIMGHEGSVRFYKNLEIVKLNSDKITGKEQSFLSKNLKRIFNLKKYPFYVKTILCKIFGKKTNNSYNLTAAQTIEEGLFESLPTNDIIDRIVDCYVPKNVNMANEGIGFDFKSLCMHEEWELIFSKTYNFTKNKTPVDKLEADEKRKYNYLEEKYPDDGLNFCCLWKRKSS